MQIINALATLFLLNQRASTAADTNPYNLSKEYMGAVAKAEADGAKKSGESEEFMACMDTKCAALLSGMKEFPENWGSETEADMASMKSNQAIAKLVDCTCQNCGDFDEVKDWLARGDGTGCAVAKAEAEGAGKSGVCVGTKCAALLSAEIPKNWGSGTEADMASMRSDQALAKLVDCTCQNCGDFDEVKDWLARGDGTGCAVAKAEADKPGDNTATDNTAADQDPATEPSGDKYFKDPTGDNTATDNTAAELDPPMELSGDKNFEDPDSAGLRQGLAAVAPLCAAALAYACL